MLTLVLIGTAAAAVVILAVLCAALYVLASAADAVTAPACGCRNHIPPPLPAGPLPHDCNPWIDGARAGRGSDTRQAKGRSL